MSQCQVTVAPLSLTDCWEVVPLDEGDWTMPPLLALVATSGVKPKPEAVGLIVALNETGNA